MTKARVHQPISENHCLFQPQLAIASVDDVGNCFLRHRLVDVRELHALRQDARQQSTADGGVENLGDLNNFAVSFAS